MFLNNNVLGASFKAVRRVHECVYLVCIFPEICMRGCYLSVGMTRCVFRMQTFDKRLSDYVSVTCHVHADNSTNLERFLRNMWDYHWCFDCFLFLSLYPTNIDNIVRWRLARYFYHRPPTIIAPLKSTSLHRSFEVILILSELHPFVVLRSLIHWGR